MEITTVLELNAYVKEVAKAQELANKAVLQIKEQAAREYETASEVVKTYLKTYHRLEVGATVVTAPNFLTPLGGSKPHAELLFLVTGIANTDDEMLVLNLSYLIELDEMGGDRYHYHHRTKSTHEAAQVTDPVSGEVHQLTFKHTEVRIVGIATPDETTAGLYKVETLH